VSENWLSRFWAELLRRKVVRVAVVYTVVAWAAVEAASVIFPALLLPEWTERLVVALALLGFPIALSLAWAFEVRPERAEAEPQASAPEPAGEERLDGWKRIAAYLNRDVRTVRRWEKDRGLPARRIMHDKLATVYTYRSELDARMPQRDTDAPEKPAARDGIPGKPGLRWVWVALPALALGMALAWLWRGQDEAPISFGEWDWVLITKFDNRTGESVLDGTVEYALERELSNSSFVKVVSHERINDALALMKLPPESEIDLSTGREISLRDGGIRILLGGRIEKLGNSYLISTDLINPDDGVTLASFSADATSQDQILGQIRTLSGEVRTALGESLQLIEASKEMLAKVTTPSLQALRLYSEAEELMRGPERMRAVAILEQALRMDPDFASAHVLLSYVLRDRNDHEGFREHLQRAVELADQAAERERLFILATYYRYLEDRQREIETYELLVRLYPDHLWASGNLSNIYEIEGRFKEAKALRTRVAESRPNSVGWYPDLDVVQLSVVTGDTDSRDKYVQKLKAVADQPGFGWVSPQMAVLPAHQAWVNGDYEKALDRAEAALAAQDREDLLDNGFLYAHIRSIYLALGTLERFREISSWRPELGWFEALLDYDSGRPETLNRYLSSTELDEWGGWPGKRSRQEHTLPTAKTTHRSNRYFPEQPGRRLPVPTQPWRRETRPRRFHCWSMMSRFSISPTSGPIFSRNTAWRRLMSSRGTSRRPSRPWRKSRVRNPCRFSS
jgi:tetratricopeptide (TPR) repeat protein